MTLRYCDLKRLKFITSSVVRFAKESNNTHLAILDAGCGIGKVTRHIAELGYEIIGIDSESKYVETAHAIPHPANCSFQCCNILEAETLGRKFDVVILSEVISYFENPTAIVGKLKQLLQIPGQLIMTTPNILGPWSLLEETPARAVTSLLRFLGVRNLPRRYTRLYTFRYIEELLHGSGLYIARASNSDFILSFLPKLKHSRLAKADTILADKLPKHIVSGWYFDSRLKQV